MIADDRASLERPVYDVLESLCGTVFVGVGMIGRPLVHFGDVRCRSVDLEKLAPIRATPLHHELGLLVNISPAVGDANVSLRELLLRHANQRFDIGRTRFASSLAAISRLTRRVMCMCLVMVVPVPGIHGFWWGRWSRHRVGSKEFA
jgi:hypothetical protein